MGKGNQQNGGLGKLGSLLHPSGANGKKSTMRALKYKRRAKAQRLDRVDPVTGKYPLTHWCGLPLKEDVVTLVKTESGGVMPSDVQFCKAVWACPVCGSIIRRARGAEISKGVENWQRKGGGVYFVTVTIRHDIDDDLRFLLDIMSDAWRRTVSGKVWQRFKKSWGWVGYTRTLEITMSQKNGWHPHYHFLVFTDDAANDKLAARMERDIYDRFSKFVAKVGAVNNVPNVAHGVDVRPVDVGGKVLGTYVSKLGSIAAEVSASQTKEGRLPAHLDPFQLLDINEDWARDAWRDYVAGTKGKRSIYFSRGLRKKLGLAVEKDDEQVVDDALDGAHDVVGAVDMLAYCDIMTRKLMFDELDAALTYAAKDKWNDAAAVLSLSLDNYVDCKTGVTVPLLC